MPNSVLKEALGLGRSVIEGVRIEGGSTIVSAGPRRRAPGCPVCGRRCDGYDRLATRRWRATDLGASRCYLEYAPLRVRCPERGVVIEAPDPHDLGPGPALSTRRGRGPSISSCRASRRAASACRSAGTCGRSEPSAPQTRRRRRPPRLHAL